MSSSSFALTPRPALPAPQPLNEGEARLREEVARLMPAALADLGELVAIASVADAQVVDQAEPRRSAELVAQKLREAGLANARTVQMPDDSTAVFASDDAAGADAPRVLLYAHHDVQPADPARWSSDPWTLVELENGRWAGRGAADDKGSLVAHLTTLRALSLQGSFPTNLTVVIEGSEEQGGAGLDEYLAEHPEQFRADVVLIADAGNVSVGTPTLTTALRGTVDVTVRLRTGSRILHSGSFGGPAPDPVTTLVQLLGTLHDEQGNVTIDGLPNEGRWDGEPYPAEQFRADAGLAADTPLRGAGEVADQVWARPALTFIGWEVPPLVGSLPAIVPEAAVRLNLRVPANLEAQVAQELLVAHLRHHVRDGVEITITAGAAGEGFAARVESAEFTLIAQAMADAFGAVPVTFGQGGSIPLTTKLQQLNPEAMVALVGVSDPAANIHAENESVDATEIQHLALAQALFLRRLGAQQELGASSRS